VDHLERGFCGTRENRKGNYYVLTYGNPCAVHIDPIEKKPFSHFMPKSETLSISTAGCNMMCKFCQNWQISQFRPEQTDNVHLPPEKVVAIARERTVPIIAYTYAEPIVFYEYMYDCSELAHKHNIKNVMITAGYINEEPLIELIKVMDAVKVDLKAFTQDYYHDICSSELAPVLKCLEILYDNKIWLEIVYLVVPTLNDDLKTIREMSYWIKNNLSEDVPIHFSRFHPTYMLKNLQPTPISTLENIRKTALDAGLNYVYIGNVVGHNGEHTYCPGCNKILIRRVGYRILENHIKNGSCEFCNRKIAGVWQ
jgi:pyruvate formate lyase activating enzyme